MINIYPSEMKLQIIPVIASEAKQPRLKTQVENQLLDYAAGYIQGYNISWYKSRQSGFICSIIANFFFREPAFICFSRAIASIMFS